MPLRLAWAAAQLRLEPCLPVNHLGLRTGHLWPGCGIPGGHGLQLLAQRWSSLPRGLPGLAGGLAWTGPPAGFERLLLLALSQLSTALLQLCLQLHCMFAAPGSYLLGGQQLLPQRRRLRAQLRGAQLLRRARPGRGAACLLLLLHLHAPPEPLLGLARHPPRVLQLRLQQVPAAPRLLQLLVLALQRLPALDEAPLRGLQLLRRGCLRRLCR
mmetsp:Transcript_45291/g.107634  ORF Transcript_45291/g.107634 Transcript_45291/m.107634 type:complete len:213 (+) Transcript_45291:466-1104(+)